MITHPARLHVLLAREASTALIIRRGPSKNVCTLGWNRACDTLTAGQWLKGRIREKRCDLSPDGRYFVYFAFKGDDREYRSWTALSSAPYLKAHRFWPKGNTWHGGGLFLDNNHLWINGFADHKEERIAGLTDTRPVVTRVDEWPDFQDFGGEDLGVYFLRLLRDGWSIRESSRLGDWHDLTIWEKPINAFWLLRKLAHATLHHPVGKGCYYDEHLLINQKTNEQLDGKAWEWADFDGARLLWAEGGKIFARLVSNNTFGETSELFDLNDMSFEPLVATY